VLVHYRKICNNLPYMQFVVTQPLIEKTFNKVGQELGNNFEINTSEDAVAFMTGFVDSLKKEAQMDPSQVLGFIKYVTEIGYQNAVHNKTASVAEGEEMDALFDSMHEKMSALMIKSAEGSNWNPLNWVPNVKGWAEKNMREGAYDATKEKINQTVGDISTQVGDFANKAWDTIKNPEFLGKVAPYAIGALGGYLIPKLLGAGGNGLVNAGLGAAAVGGGKHLFDKYDLSNPQSWQKYKDQALNFINGIGAQPK
jgi:hypothetical protein